MIGRLTVEKNPNLDTKPVLNFPPPFPLWHVSWLLYFVLIDIPLLPLTCSSRSIWLQAFVINPIIGIFVCLERWNYASRTRCLLSTDGVGRDRSKIKPWKSISNVELRIGYRWGLEIKADDGSEFFISRWAKDYRQAIEVLRSAGKLKSRGGMIKGKQTRDIALTIMAALLFLAYFCSTFHGNRVALLKGAATNGCISPDSLILKLYSWPK